MKILEILGCQYLLVIESEIDNSKMTKQVRNRPMPVELKDKINRTMKL